MEPTCRSRFLSISLDKSCRHRGHPFAHDLAYAGRIRIYDPRTGLTYNFSSEKADVEASGLEGFKGSLSELVHEVVFSETRDIAVEGRTLIVAIAHELSAIERLAFIRALAAYLSAKFGAAVYYALHRPPADGDDRNFHAHLVFSSRSVVGENRLGRKTRELDSLKTGGLHVEELRVWITAKQNEMLQAAGHEANLEHRSLERLGISREPIRHRGERRTAINRRRHLRELSTPRVPAPCPVPTLRPLSQPRSAPIPNVVPAVESSAPAVPQPMARQEVQLLLIEPSEIDCGRVDGGPLKLRTHPVTAQIQPKPVPEEVEIGGPVPQLRQLRSPVRAREGPIR
jgi:hypothetical protein